MQSDAEFYEAVIDHLEALTALIRRRVDALPDEPYEAQPLVPPADVEAAA